MPYSSRSNIPSTLTSTPAGVTASAGELNVLDNVTAGTVAVSKAVVVDSNKDVGDFRNLDAVNIDAGASGTAGTVDIFPTTASKGKIALTAADSAGNTTTTIVNASQAGARTYTIPDAGASASFVMTAGTQTLSGTTTITTLNATNIDAGASGTAGSVDVFPTTASKGKIAITAANSAGDTTTTIVNASQAAARTYTIPDALANAEFLLGVQGTTARTATADGLTTGTIADAGREQFIVVTSSDANHIIVLPTPTPGTRVSLLNGGTGYELRSSDPATIAINGGTGASAESAIGANIFVEMICVSATAWLGRTMTAAGVVGVVEVAA